ncbi:MAG: hypothetical protein AAF628_37960 [Planctomycetota bacterium]
MQTATGQELRRRIVLRAGETRRLHLRDVLDPREAAASPQRTNR